MSEKFLSKPTAAQLTGDIDHRDAVQECHNVPEQTRPVADELPGHHRLSCPIELVKTEGDCTGHAEEQGQKDLPRCPRVLNAAPAHGERDAGCCSNNDGAPSAERRLHVSRGKNALQMHWKLSHPVHSFHFGGKGISRRLQVKETHHEDHRDRR